MVIRYLHFIILCLVVLAGCKSYSKYPIDNRPLEKTDTSLLGIWKIDGKDKKLLWATIKDTDKANFILVQQHQDIIDQATSWRNMDAGKKRAVFAEYYKDDTASLNEAMKADARNINDTTHIAEMRKRINTYDITYFNAGGRNPQYQQWDAYLSKVGNEHFLNTTYRDYHLDNKGEILDVPTEDGYLLVRLVKVTKDSIAAAVVADSTLKKLTNCAAVRKLVTKNLNNKSFYCDTVHFYKVSSYHLSLNEAMKKAN